MENIRETLRKNKEIETIRETLRKHLDNEYTYSHRIDVEPTPSYPISKPEIEQMFSMILHRINRRYLRSKYYWKWKPDDKFWIVGCRQGGKGTGSEKHYHLLLHSPEGHSVNVMTDLILGVSQNVGRNPINGERRQIWRNYKDKFHFSNEDLEKKCLINAEPVRNQTGSIKYNTRQLNKNLEEHHFLEGDELFFIQ